MPAPSVRAHRVSRQDRVRSNVTMPPPPPPERPAVSPSAVVELHASVSRSGFVPNTFSSSKKSWTQVFVADEDGASVASGSLEEPCRPGDGNGSFYSGAMSKGDTFSVEIRDIDGPLFFYNPNGRDCADGAVGVINPASNDDLATYAAAAKKFDRPGVAPSDPFGGFDNRGPSTISVPDVVVVADTSGNNDIADQSLHTGIIVIAVFGGIIALGVVLSIGWWAWYRWASRRGDNDAGEAAAKSPPPKRPDETFDRAFGDLSGVGTEIKDDGTFESDEDLEKAQRWRSSTEKVSIGTLSMTRSSWDNKR